MWLDADADLAERSDGRPSLRTNQTGDLLPPGPVLYSENGVKGATQRFTGLSQRRQRGKNRRAPQCPKI